MLRRWDPYREMMSMRRAMDRLIDSSFDSDLGTAEWSLPLDVVENQEAFLVKASIPGVKADDLEITFDKGMLTIKGELKDETERQEGQYHLRERRYGIFTRTVALPASVRASDIQARCEDGVLTLTLPKAEEARPQRIQVQNGSKLIEGKSN